MPKWYGGSALYPDETIEPQNQWLMQFYRVKRWHDGTLSLKSKNETEPLTPYDLDTIISFFQNCYHLRDWLESSKPDLHNNIETLFENNFEMQACRDICHGFKHKNPEFGVR